MKPSKYVVILESDSGYMDCIAICDKAEEAYGEAFLALVDGIEEGAYISLPDDREGENGIIIELRRKEDDKVLHWATVLFYRPEEQEDEE